jgi:hypothetical protein
MEKFNFDGYRFVARVDYWKSGESHYFKYEGISKRYQGFII